MPVDDATERRRLTRKFVLGLMRSGTPDAVISEITGLSLTVLALMRGQAGL